MSLVLRAAFVYFFLLVLVRIAGRRTLADATPFDLILLLVLGETVNNALIRSDDHSLTSAAIVACTFVALEVGLALWRANSTRCEKILDGTPLVVVERGKILLDRIRRARVTESDILAAARQQGRRSLNEVDFVVLEANGKLSVVVSKSD